MTFAELMALEWVELMDAVAEECGEDTVKRLNAENASRREFAECAVEHEQRRLVQLTADPRAAPRLFP